ncbi:MAG: type I DNA topoisomerase [Planctomycetota bacterium]|nr:type I DNA topoisomerase [Planctomycetota bacterium]MDI6786934.1 type I DNA topoisomerase [Planctomycetota bacterium]
MKMKKKATVQAENSQNRFVAPQAPLTAIKSLVIVESPAKIKTISRILGDDYLIKSSYGHIRDLPKSRLGIDIENNFTPTYQSIRKQIKNINELKKISAGSKMVYLATDPDREGEAIAWHLSVVLKVPEEKIWRVSFDEITAPAVRKAFEEPRKISINLVNAQQARRLLDRIMGYTLSPLLWKKITKGLSAGRVQSVALQLIVEREKQIKAFKTREYWKITAELLNEDSSRSPYGLKDKEPSPLSGSEPLVATIPIFIGTGRICILLTKLNDVRVGSPLDTNTNIWLGAESESKKLVECLLKSEFIVSSIIEKDAYQYPPPPFITSTLQQVASTRLNFSPKKTMVIAQQLYEGIDLPEGPTGLITYMRTDSVRVSELAINECRKFISQQYGETLLHPEARRYKPSKQSQQAHEAIRPTYVSKTPDSIAQYLTKDQYKLYDLIWKCFVATQMKPALWHNKTVEIEATLSPALDLSVFSNDKRKNIIAEKILQGLQDTEHRTQDTEHRTKIITILNKNKEDKITAMNILEELGKDPTDKALIVNVLGILDEPVENNLLAESLSVQKCVFGASEHRLLFKGFLILHQPEEQLLPALKENEKLTPVNITPSQSFTNPPSRYTEAMLVKVLEKYGIGRPSTYAPIISTIQDRGYVIKISRALLPTELGVLVNDKLVPFFDDIINTKFTAQIEEELDLIEEDKKDWVSLLREFYEPFSKDLEKAGEEMTSEKGKEVADMKCPKCSSTIVERWSRFGRFLACAGYPECKHTISLKIKPETILAHQTCEKCGKEMIVKTNRRARKFIACSGYPECKNAKPFRETAPHPKSEILNSKFQEELEELIEEGEPS